MKINLQYLKKRYSGGRLANIQTFCNVCDSEAPDAQWLVDKTLQVDSSDGFSVIGLSKILETPVILKIMDNTWRSKKEKKVNKVFRLFPHKNIVQSICEFSCKDDKIKWLTNIEAPRLLCSPNGKTDFTIIVQEFIKGGDLSENIKWNYNTWKSVTLQLLFTSIELFDKFGFIYEDWNLRNILWDTTDVKTIIYLAYNKKWTVRNTYSISPVFTDFSRSDILLNKKEDWHLAVQLSHCLDMMKNVCHHDNIKKITETCSIQIELLENISDILFCIKSLVNQY
jgi:hypothetical protein